MPTVDKVGGYKQSYCGMKMSRKRTREIAEEAVEGGHALIYFSMEGM